MEKQIGALREAAYIANSALKAMTTIEVFGLAKYMKRPETTEAFLEAKASIYKAYLALIAEANSLDALHPNK